jgi:hypothetical protein
MTLDLTDDEARSLAILLRPAIDDDPYPLSLRLAPLKAILGRSSIRRSLGPCHRRPLKAYDAPCVVKRRRQRG